MVRRLCIAVLVTAVITQTGTAEAAGRGGILNWFKSKTSRSQAANMPRGGTNHRFPTVTGSQARQIPTTARPATQEDVRRAIAEATQSRRAAQPQQQAPVSKPSAAQAVAGKWRAATRALPDLKTPQYFPSRFRKSSPPVRTAQRSAPVEQVPANPTTERPTVLVSQPRELPASVQAPVQNTQMMRPVSAPTMAAPMYVMPAAHNHQPQAHPHQHVHGYPQTGASLYPCPVPNVPFQVGMTAITNQAFYPHEYMYPHEYKAIYPPYYYHVKGKWAVTPFGVWSHERWKPMGTEVSVKYRSRISPFAGFRPPHNK